MPATRRPSYEKTLSHLLRMVQHDDRPLPPARRTIPFPARGLVRPARSPILQRQNRPRPHAGCRAPGPDPRPPCGRGAHQHTSAEVRHGLLAGRPDRRPAARPDATQRASGHGRPAGRTRAPAPAARCRLRRRAGGPGRSPRRPLPRRGPRCVGPVVGSPAATLGILLARHTGDPDIRAAAGGASMGGGRCARPRARPPGRAGARSAISRSGCPVRANGRRGRVPRRLCPRSRTARSGRCDRRHRHTPRCYLRRACRLWHR